MAGRPKRVFSEETVKEIERLALLNCNTNTIATALDIPFKTLQRHFAKKLSKCRSMYKVRLRENQDKLSETSAEMAKFLGKNELDQTDKRVLANETPVQQLNEAEVEAVKDLARQYKLRLARGSSYKAG